MSKELEALEKINHTICLNNLNHNIEWALDKYDGCDCKDFTEFAQCYDVIEQKLKAFEIAKEVGLDVDVFERTCRHCDYKFYLDTNEYIMNGMARRFLKEEEFYILQKELGDYYE